MCYFPCLPTSTILSNYDFWEGGGWFALMLCAVFCLGSIIVSSFRGKQQTNIEEHTLLEALETSKNGGG